MNKQKSWTLSNFKREKSTGTISSLLLQELKKNPEATFNSASVMKNFKCSRGAASNVLALLKKANKIKLVGAGGKGTSLCGVYQSIKGSKDKIRIAPQKGYMSISNFLKKKKISVNSALWSKFRKFLNTNKIEARVGMPCKCKLSYVYPVDVLEKQYKKFNNTKEEVKVVKEMPAKNKISKAVNKEESQQPIIKKVGFTLFGITIFGKEIGITLK